MYIPLDSNTPGQELAMLVYLTTFPYFKVGNSLLFKSKLLSTRALHANSNDFESFSSLSALNIVARLHLLEVFKPTLSVLERGYFMVAFV